MRAHVLGFPTALGMPRPVRDHAPAALRRLGLLPALRRVLDATDLGDVVVERANVAASVDLRLRKVLEAAERQARAFVATFAADTLPITLGGDHSTSLGTALALYRLGLSFDLVWIDAHADFNTPETSPSGNPHGMVLALLAGLTPYLARVVEPRRLHLWGVRSLDPGERALLAAHGPEVRDVAATRAAWPLLLQSLASDVFLSFDCDACQPAVAPGTMTPVDSGFDRAEVLRMMRQIAASRRVLALDVVELHPDRDRGDRTAVLARDVIVTVARAQARFRSGRKNLSSLQKKDQPVLD